MTQSENLRLPLFRRLENAQYAPDNARRLALDSEHHFKNWAVINCGNVPSLTSVSFLPPEIGVEKAQLEILEDESQRSRLLLGIKKGADNLASKVILLYDDMNSGPKLWLPRFSTKKRRDAYDQIAELIGEDRRIKPRRFFAFDNMVSGLAYSSLASYAVGFVYHHFYAGQDMVQSLSWINNEQNATYVLAASALSIVCAIGAQLRRGTSDEIKEKARRFQELVERVGFVKRERK